MFIMIILLVDAWFGIVFNNNNHCEVVIWEVVCSRTCLCSIQAELKSLQEVASASFTYAQDLIKHNLVVFRSGEGSLQILPPLIDVLPEARLNLVIYYLRQGWSDFITEIMLL